MQKQNVKASALSLLAIATGVLAVVQMDIKRAGPITDASLQSRSTITSSLLNNVTFGSYIISTQVGTPGQAIDLVLDTGSSDVFVLASTADQCTDEILQEEYGPCYGGTYKSTSSSTYKFINDEFSIQYGDNTGSQGDYFSDNLVLGTSTIKTLQMGLAYHTTVGTGIMGIGYDTNEAALTEYPSIIDQMVSQGLIPIKAYSLYLDDLQASSGSILFGGIDTAKYIGALTAVPIEKDTSTGMFDSFTVALTSVSMTAQDGSTTNFNVNTLPAPVVLDSGTTLTYLPNAVCEKLFSAIGAVDQSDGGTTSGNVLVDCDLQTNDPNMKINYGFGTGGPQISVDISGLIFSISDSGSNEKLPFTNTCVFGIMPAGDVNESSGAVFLLGDTFLRSAYVVYDITNNQVAMAPASFNQAESNVQEISASAASVPLPVGQGVSSSSPPSSPTSSSSSSPSSSTSSSSSSSSSSSLPSSPSSLPSEPSSLPSSPSSSKLSPSILPSISSIPTPTFSVLPSITGSSTPSTATAKSAAQHTYRPALLPALLVVFSSLLQLLVC